MEGQQFLFCITSEVLCPGAVRDRIWQIGEEQLHQLASVDGRPCRGLTLSFSQTFCLQSLDMVAFSSLVASCWLFLTKTLTKYINSLLDTGNHIG